MTDYVKSTNFASKDSLATGNPLKIVKGTEIDTEFNNIATAVATKADLNSPTFIGTPTAPTASTGTNTTQVATTAFVQTATTAAVNSERTNNTSIGGVGSIIRAAVYSATTYYPGDTINGNLLYYPNTGSGVVTGSVLNTGNSAFYLTGVAIRYSSGNTGAQPPSGSTALTGVWRFLEFSNAMTVEYPNDIGGTTTNMQYVMLVRVS